jgi:hypothetical protein
VTDVRIYCDHGDHAPKISKITTLRRDATGAWSEAPEVAFSLKAASGGSADRWVPRTPFQIIEDEAGGHARWDFPCSISSRHHRPVRQEKLFPALDALAESGQFDVSLELLAATLKMLARARPGA